MERRLAIKIRPNRIRRNDASPSLPLSISLFPSGFAFARGAACGSLKRMRTGGPWNICCALVECSFAAFAEGPRETDGEKRKRVERGGESLSVRAADGRRGGRGTRRGRAAGRGREEDSAGRRGWSMGRPRRRRRRATLLENKAGFSP